MSEINKILTRYKKRECISHRLYSHFTPGNLFMMHQREKKFISLLKYYKIQDLSQLKIFDIGCGNGAWLRELVQYGAVPKNLFGIDLLTKQVKKAHLLSPNISISQGNAEHLHFPDKSFDIVQQNTVFTSILNNKMKCNIAKEMLRVVKDNGFIIWYDFRYNNPNNTDVQGIEKEEIKFLFPNCKYNFHRITLIPPLARVLAKVHFSICNFFSLFPFLLSHYLVFIKKKI